MDARPQSGMKFEVGKPISIRLADSRSLRGFVHAEDKAAAIVCLELIPSAEIAIVSTVNIKSFEYLTDCNDSRKWPATPTVDFAKAKADEARIFAKREAEFNLLGAGVSETAQAVFNTLNKTLPCRWDRNVIVILDSVHLSPPYDAKSITGDGDAGVVNRVKMILQREYPAIKATTEVNGVTP